MVSDREPERFSMAAASGPSMRARSRWRRRWLQSRLTRLDEVTLYISMFCRSSARPSALRRSALDGRHNPAPPSRSADALDYELGPTGTPGQKVPALDYVNGDLDIAEVRFGDFDATARVLIDRKHGVATTQKGGHGSSPVSGARAEQLYGPVGGPYSASASKGTKGHEGCRSD
jgi:hypothetical protein